MEISTNNESKISLDEMDEIIDFVDNCIKIRKTMFSFIKCLHCIEDKKEFISQWIKYLNLNNNYKSVLISLSTGEIPIDIWDRVMNSCNFLNKYMILRKAYYGENGGRRKIADKCKYDALIRVFGESTYSRIYLLIDNNHITSIDSSKIMPSNWVNEDADFLCNTYLE